MDYTNNPAGPPSNLQPDQEDRRQLEAIYGHDDNNPDTRQMLPDRFLKVRPRRGRMGRLVQESMDGGVRVYEVDFSQGRKMATYVLGPPARK